MAHITSPGMKTLAKQRWEREQAIQKAQQAAANKAAHAKVLASLGK